MYTKILILTFFVCIGISPIHSKTITKGDINDLLTQIDQIIDEGEKYHICAYMLPTASIVWLGTAKVMTKSTHTSKSTTSIRIFSQIQPCMPSS